MKPRPDALFTTVPPIGLDREEAAAYVRAGTTLFDEMVSDGRMPQPRLMNSRRVWDREELYFAFKSLPRKGGEAEAIQTKEFDWSKMR